MKHTQTSLVVITESSRYPIESWQAREKIWKCDFDGADQILEKKMSEQKAKGQRSTWLHFCHAEVAFYRHGIDSSKKNAEELVKRCDLVEDILDNLDSLKPSSSFMSMFNSDSADEKKRKNSLYFDGLVASGYFSLLRALFSFRMEEPVKGSYHMLKSWGFFNDGKKFLAEFGKDMVICKDMNGLLNFGLGVFHFTLSLIPPALQLISSLAGIEANREEGIKEITSAMESGCPRAVESVMILSMIKRILFKQDEDADKMVEQIRAEYADSFITYIFCGWLDRYRGKIEDSVAYFKKSQEFYLPDSQAYGVSYYYLGYLYWMIQDYAQVVANLEKFLAIDVEVTKKRCRPYGAFLLGLCYWRLSETKSEELVNKIVTLYKQAQDWINEDESYDVVAQRKMKNFLATKKFTEWEELFEDAVASLEGKQEDKLAAITEQLRAKFETDKERSQECIYFTHYLTGAINAIKKNWTVAKEHLNTVIGVSPTALTVNSSFIIPFSLMILSEIAIEENDLATAEKYIDRIKQEKTKCDWEKIVQVRIFVGAQTIENKKGVKK